ncbi:MAG: PQQ-dependent sugar dehydrogenase, partial [Gammaproteobacteria bacterium]|nr:PQQ-dependent sugar dehydrogenase [Gammaproteobacteria bacterium]
MHKLLKSIVCTNVILLFMLTGFSYSAQDYQVSTVAENLEYPWSIAFLPNGDMLVTEREGNLRLIHKGELLKQSIGGLPEIYVQGQGGLFDVLVDPDFDTNQKLYISFASGDRNANALKVISARLEGMALNNVKTILTISPTKDTPHHFGGRMALIGDGSLLVTSGEGFNYREKAQSLDNMLGKILRINTDGSIPSDNPFLKHEKAKPEIYSYGHRNPQAILVSKAGKIWSHEHGPKGGDELNLIAIGLNYGWPAVTFGIDYSGAVISPFTEAEGMEQPVINWVPSIAPAGMTEYQGDIFPQWQGNLFVAALAEKSVHR